MKVLAGAGVFTHPPGPPLPAGGAGSHWVEHLRAADLSVGSYSIRRGGPDEQMPHTEDEIYVVTAGRAVLKAGEDSTPVGPGSVVYVAAGETHRFTDVTEDLAAIVLFAPAEGTRSRTGSLFQPRAAAPSRRAVVM